MSNNNEYRDSLEVEIMSDDLRDEVVEAYNKAEPFAIIRNRDQKVCTHGKVGEKPLEAFMNCEGDIIDAYQIVFNKQSIIDDIVSIREVN